MSNISFNLNQWITKQIGTTCLLNSSKCRESLIHQQSFWFLKRSTFFGATNLQRGPVLLSFFSLLDIMAFICFWISIAKYRHAHKNVFAGLFLQFVSEDKFSSSIIFSLTDAPSSTAPPPCTLIWSASQTWLNMTYRQLSQVRKIYSAFIDSRDYIIYYISITL